MSEQWHVEENVRPGGSYNICHGTRVVALYATLEDAEQIVRDHNAAQAGDEGTVARLRALLARTLRYLDFVEDRGPTGEGWQSDELIAFIGQIRAALAHEPAAAERPLSHNDTCAGCGSPADYARMRAEAAGDPTA